MGDVLDENDEIYITNSMNDSEDERLSIESGMEEGSGSDNEDDEKLREEVKKAKRKLRIHSMKEKKRMRIAEEANDAEQETLAQFSAEEMLTLIEKHIPSAMLNTQSVVFNAQGDKKAWSEATFFSPQLDPQGVTESLTKKSCPFVRALSASLPNYKKLLFSQNAASNKLDSISTTEVSTELFGCPIVVIIAASATRCTQIIKSISAKLIKVKVAKLFAKHIKVSEQISMLSKEYFPLAIGTPHRVQKLLEVGALYLSHTTIVLVDHTPDIKKFTIFTQPDIVQDWYGLLYQSVYEHREHLKIALVRDQLDTSSGAEGAEEGHVNEQKKAKASHSQQRKPRNLQQLKFIKDRQQKRSGKK
ncbi:hypothetical protein EON65_00120 [archaeon]|nr:MAG: hypothetical protein EON65_00120 [archaeon]